MLNLFVLYLYKLINQNYITMTVLSNISTRTYEVSFIPSMKTPDEIVTDKVTIDALTSTDENNDELIYSLQEDLDAILDLKVGEGMPIQADRDNSKSIGIILRIK